MEFAEVTIKESPGLCRCCLSEGCYKDLGSEYTWMNETEVYADMLLDCFDIGISQHNDGPNGPKRLICEVCITRLRDACNFKKQVVDSEKKFIDMLGRGEFRPMEKQTVLLPIYTSQTPMKAEAIEEVTVSEDYEDTNVEFLDDIDYTEDEEVVKAEAKPPEPVASTSAKRGRPRKADTEPPEKKPKVKPKTTKIPKEFQYPDDTESSKHSLADTDSQSELSQLPAEKTEDLKDMKMNIRNLVQASSVMPFRWLISAFRCFYCYDVFRHPDDLKSHYVLHDDSEICNAMNTFWDRYVYIDVSVLNCKLCPATFDAIDDLISHLIVKHKIPFNEKVHCFQAFRLGEKVACTICNAKYENFAQLLIHSTSLHQRSDDRLCHVCGRTFKPHQIKMHLANEHRRKNVKCTKCEKSFNPHTIRTHMTRAHNIKFKCKMCQETFETVYQRAAHLTTVHKGRDPVHCPVCPNVYYFQSTMRRHVKQVHAKEKNVQCDICGWKGFKAFNLKIHMKKHKLNHTEQKSSIK